MRSDAVVVGAGPNGLAAAIELARAGLSVTVLEARAEIGGAAKSLPLTEPGFVHDPFSSIYPLAAGSPFLGRLPLAEHGLEWVHSPAPLAHPFDDGTAAILERSIDGTAETLGREGAAWRSLVQPVVHHWERTMREVLAPLHLPRAPLALGRFGVRAIRSAEGVAGRLGGGRGAALLTGSAAHSGLPLDAPASAAFGLVLSAAGHAVGWPFPAGGAGRLTEAMAGYLHTLGGRIDTGRPVRSLADLPPHRIALLDLTPRQFLAIAGDRLPRRYARRLRAFDYGVGVFKIDYALSEAIPWAAEACRRAATVHLGGSASEIARSARTAASGGHPDAPFLLVAQHTLFDPSRAPAGRHTAWAYCHVPNGSTVDMTDRIERQIERFAPGFRDVVLARARLTPARLESMDENLVGGDVNGGSARLGQLFFRPVVARDPYATPVDGVLLCSASTPPGGGVHGMCGFHAARSALRRLGVDPALL